MKRMLGSVSLSENVAQYNWARPSLEFWPDHCIVFTENAIAGAATKQPRSLSKSWNLPRLFIIDLMIPIWKSFYTRYTPGITFLFTRTHIWQADHTWILRTVGQKLKCSAHFRFDSFIFARLHTRGYKPVLEPFQSRIRDHVPPLNFAIFRRVFLDKQRCFSSSSFSRFPLHWTI